jgi:hypothetical protein
MVKSDSFYSFQFKEMARPARLELATLCLEGRRSIQLSYGRYADSKRFPVSTTILKCPFTVIL